MWKDLTISQKGDIIKMSLQNGIKGLDEIKRFYDETAHKFDDGGFKDNTKKFVKNFVHAPISAVYDLGLYTADKLGLPSNVANFLRDTPNAIKYKLSALPSALFDALRNYATKGNFSLEEAYMHYLKNPSLFQRLNTIEPLTNNNGNYNDEELSVMKEMAGKKGYITNQDIIRVSNNYGGQGSIKEYVTSPAKVVQTSIGRAAKGEEKGTMKDVFDTNISTGSAQHDNIVYLEGAKNNPGFNYYTIRAVMPFVGSNDVMPDDYKIHTNINLNEIEK